MSADKFEYYTPAVRGWGENPIVHSTNGHTFVYATNPAVGTVHCAVDSGPLEVIDSSFSHPSGMDVTPDHRIRAVVEVGDTLKGRQSYLSLPEEYRRVKLPVMGSNDMVAIKDSSGNVAAYAITAIGNSLEAYAKTQVTHLAPLTFVRPGGDPFVTTSLFSCPNGIDVTHDRRELMVAVSHENRLVASRLTDDSDVIEEEWREVIRFEDGPSGMPDGIATFDGGIAVAMPYACKAVIVSGGEIARTISSPSGELVVATALCEGRLYAVLTIPGPAGDMFNGTWRIGVTDF